LFAGSVGSLNTFVNGTVADADAVNANFAAIQAAVDDNHARIGTVENATGVVGSAGSTEEAAATSCKAILDARPGVPDGLFWVNPDGAGAALRVWCDMGTDGGGWTPVAMANASSYVNNWNAGGSLIRLLQLDGNTYQNDIASNAHMSRDDMDAIGASEVRVRTSQEHVVGRADAPIPSVWDYFLQCYRSGPAFSTADAWVEAHVTLENLATGATSENAHCWDLNSNQHSGWSSSDVVGLHMLHGTTIASSHPGLCSGSTCWSEHGTIWVR
jgi:hypothetical protein